MISTLRRASANRSEAASHRQDALQLAALIRDCRTADIERHVAVVRLSKLDPDRLRPHHLRLARAAMEPLAHADRARLFVLPSRDLVAVWRGAADLARTTSRNGILHLFGGDERVPLASDLLWQDHALPRDADVLLRLARGPEPDQARPPAEPMLIPLDPGSLSALESQLVHADVARFVRRLKVAELEPGGGLALAWEKRRLDITELAACLSSRHDLRAEPWLFRRLTRTLDRRMLALLAAQGELAEAGPFSVQLNIASLLGPEFLRFDGNLPPHLRGRVSIDLAPEDVLADPAAFLFARDFARGRGYRLILSGLHAGLLPMLPLRRLGLDVVDLRWSEALPTLDLAALQAEPARIVLSGVEDDAALAWGRAQGIGWFAGRLVQQMLRPGRSAATPALAW